MCDCDRRPPCGALLAGGPLACVRTDPHLTGHKFESTSGVGDRHNLPEELQES